MEQMTGISTVRELDAQRVVVAGPQGQETVRVGGPRRPQAIVPREQHTVP